MSELDEAEDAYDRATAEQQGDPLDRQSQEPAEGQEENLVQEQADLQTRQEVRRDMSEDFEIPQDREFDKFKLTPFSAELSPKINGIPTLNKDYGTSLLNKRGVRFVGLCFNAIMNCSRNPRLSLVMQDYSRISGAFVNTMPSLGGWGRSEANTYIGKKEFMIENKEKKPEESGGLGGLLPWKSGR